MIGALSEIVECRVPLAEKLATFDKFLQENGDKLGQESSVNVKQALIGPMLKPGVG